MNILAHAPEAQFQDINANMYTSQRQQRLEVGKKVHCPRPLIRKATDISAVYPIRKSWRRIDTLQFVNLGSSIGLSALVACIMHVQVPSLPTARRLNISIRAFGTYNYRALRGLKRIL